MAVDRSRLVGRTCFGALDLSGKHDLTSLTLVFPDDETDPNFDILQFCWTPIEQLGARLEFIDAVRLNKIDSANGSPLGTS